MRTTLTIDDEIAMSLKDFSSNRQVVQTGGERRITKGGAYTRKSRGKALQIIAGLTESRPLLS